MRLTLLVTIISLVAATSPVSPPPSPPPPCTNEGIDRYAGKGECCATLVEVVEPRDLENGDPFACAEDDPEHDVTCYSTIIKCRLLVPHAPPQPPSPPSPPPHAPPQPSLPMLAPSPPPCTNEGTDRYAGNGECCATLVEVVEPRDLESGDPFACAVDDPEHGVTCYSTIIKCRLLVPPHTPPQPAAPPPPGCERDVQGSYGDARDGAAAV